MRCFRVNNAATPVLENKNVLPVVLVSQDFVFHRLLLEVDHSKPVDPFDDFAGFLLFDGWHAFLYLVQLVTLSAYSE